ncbi:MAG: tetratricopeptide repeat protein [Ignavibacteriaceae bacterium]
MLVDEIINGGIDAAIKKYRELKAEKLDEYNFKESELNTFGYELLKNGNTDEAIKIFELNVESFPESANVYDSLGEAYIVKGDKENAKKNYEKSLKLNPKNENAKKMLEELNE